MDDRLYGIVIIMLASGAVGGTINYLIANPDPHKFTSWLKAAFIGIGAAFLVPLFLRTISSGLLADILAKNPSKDPSADDYFVFSGFCLLAAISSRLFIQTLSDKILRETRQARREVAEVKAEIGAIETSVAPILDSMTEQDPDDSPQQKLDVINVTDLEKAVLNVLAAHPRFTLRSLTGITHEIRKERDVDREQIRAALLSLVRQGLATEVVGKTGIGMRWSITHRGKTVIGYGKA